VDDMGPLVVDEDFIPYLAHHQVIPARHRTPGLDGVTGGIGVEDVASLCMEDTLRGTRTPPVALVAYRSITALGGCVGCS
jgi:hypothetical protein